MRPRAPGTRENIRKPRSLIQRRGDQRDALDREAETATRRLCFAHAARWSKLCKLAEPISLEQWCRTAGPIGDGRRVTFAGLEPHVARQILYGIFIRSRRGSHTRLHSLQRVVEFLRQFEPTDLKLLTDVEMPPKWPKACRALLNQVMGTARYGDNSPEDFRHAMCGPATCLAAGASSTSAAFRSRGCVR
jgi:hypothetical protein